MVRHNAKTVICSVMAAASAVAATYRVDLDRPDGIYRCGETDTMGYLKGRQSGWPQVVENNSSTPARRAAAEKWAPYFDGANFASRITCPVRVAVGFSDTTCPPCAVYAAYNEIKVKDKAIGNGIGMTHSCRGHFYSQFGNWAKRSGR